MPNISTLSAVSRLTRLIQHSFLITGVTLSTPAFAQETTLEGFGDVKLGMTLQELQASHSIKPKDEKESGDKNRVYLDDQGEQIDAIQFQVSYVVKDERVISINLHAPDTSDYFEDECYARFDRVIGLLAKKYGTFDNTLHRTQTEMTKQVHSTMSKRIQERRLDVHSLYSPNSAPFCTIGVRYILNGGRSGESKL